MNQLIGEYRAQIEQLDMAIGAANNCRAAICELSRELEQIEARTVVQGIEGKNAEERKANLTLTLAANIDYVRVQLRWDEQKRCLAKWERQADVAREMCRLLRLSLAIGSDDGVRELAA
jgi:hypothetical protein